MAWRVAVFCVALYSTVLNRCATSSGAWRGTWIPA